jgi:SAM-dependent methyltransferase
MNNFTNLYSQYYNLLYKDKDYSNEFQYVLSIINSLPPPPHGNSLLDIGCGTGKHLKFFQDSGYAVAGVDSSFEMLNEARQYLGPDADLLCAKASEFKINKRFNIITSLFHVMSYQTETSEFEKVLINVSSHLVSGGLFLFDFWYGPAVLSDPPVIRIKRLEDTKIKITRLAEPVMHYNENVVDINFELFIEQKAMNSFVKLNEVHKMKYFFLPELKYFSKKAGLSFVDSYNWLTKDPLSDKSWYGFVILRKP